MKNFLQCKDREHLFKNLFLIETKTFSDARGTFLESFRASDFLCDEFLQTKFVQENISYSEKNVLRGLHFQKKHSQSKLVRVVSGKIFDVVVDLRNEEATFGKYFSCELSAQNANALFVPRGFAHGFYAIEKSIVVYNASDYYFPNDEDAILWNDETLLIDWKIPGEPILSMKDKNANLFSSEQNYFSRDGIWIGM